MDRTDGTSYERAATRVEDASPTPVPAQASGDPSAAPSPAAAALARPDAPGVGGPAQSSVAQPVDASAADRLVSQVVSRLQASQSAAGPALEARFHHADLGDVRLVVAGNAGDIVHAQLIVADARTADALARAVERAQVGSHGLAGIELKVRSEHAGLADPSAGGRGREWDGGSRAGDQTGGFREAPGGGGEGAREPAPGAPTGRNAAASRVRVAAEASARRTTVSGTLDLRA